MKFFGKLIGCLLLLGIVAVLYWSPTTPLQTPTKVTEPVPSMTAIEDFFQFPWGISRNEALKMAEARNLSPTPVGFMDYRGPDLLYNITFAGCPATIRCSFKERSNQAWSFFYKGSLSLSSRNCPIENVFSQLQQQLTDKYGAVPDLGYPPRRNSGSDKPWGPGSGLIWSAKSPDGQLFEIMAELNLSEPGFLRLSYHNISAERRFNNLANPTPAGDPAQADSKLKGFLNVPWGAGPALFQTKLATQGFAAVKKDTSPLNRSSHVAFEQGKFAGFPIQSVNAYFKHDRMHMVSVSISGDTADNGAAVYGKLKEFLQQQYGTPLTEKDFRQQTVHIWPFPLAGFKPNHIMLHRSGATVMVLYRNRALEDQLNNL